MARLAARAQSSRSVAAATSLPAEPRAAVLRLQHGAGNRATTQLVGGRALAREVKPKPPPVPYRGKQDKGSTKIPAPDTILTEEDREIAKQASSRILASWTAFSNAIGAHLASLKAEEKAKAEMAAALVEIFVGFAAPFLANVGKGVGTPGGKVASKLERVGEKLASKQGQDFQ